MRTTLLRCALLGCITASSTAWSIPFSQMVVFGNSLSDPGNVFAATSAAHAIDPSIPILPASPPYFQGRFSNGPVAVEVLSRRLHLTDRTANFAYAGATTGVGTIADFGGPTQAGALGLPGISTQVNAYLGNTGGVADPNGLYVVWGGDNDYFWWIDPASNPGVGLESVIADGVANIAQSVGALLGAGARNVLAPNVANIGLTPFLRNIGADVAALGSGYAQAFNAALESAFEDLELAFPDAQIVRYDLYSEFTRLIDDPAVFGLPGLNTTTECVTPFGQPTSVCNDPNRRVFWDDTHPTAQVHDLLARRLSGALLDAGFEVPLPDTATLMLAGVMALALYAGRRRQLEARTRPVGPRRG